MPETTDFHHARQQHYYPHANAAAEEDDQPHAHSHRHGGHKKKLTRDERDTKEHLKQLHEEERKAEEDRLK